jgi:hypothetical protein
MSRLSMLPLTATLLCALVASTMPGLSHAAGNTEGPVKLRPDEGLVVFSVRSTDEFRRIRFEDPANAEDFTLQGIVPGETLWVMRAKAGRYFMQYLRLDGRTEVKWFSQNDGVLWLEVRAGAINYPGDLFLSREGNRISYHYGSNGLEDLQYRVQREKSVAHDLLERMPFVLSGPLAGSEQDWLRCHPPAEARWSAWNDCLERPEAPDAATLVSSVFTRNGMPGITLGLSRAEVLARFKAVSARYARVATLDGIDEVAWFQLGGWWGDRGSDPVGRLWFTDGRLARVTLSETGLRGEWAPLAPDAVRDLAAYAAGN